MLKTILVPIDGSDCSRRAIDYASDIGSRFDAKIVLVHAINYPFGRLSVELHQYAVSEHLDGPGEVEAVVEKMLETAEVRATSAGVNEIAHDSRMGDPASVILEAATSCDADCIVMGSRGLGELKGLLVGSVSHKVLQHAEVPVTIVR